jgi:hypothetical protein
MTVNLSMTMIDYLLLGGFAAASVYTICRLFVGLRNSAPAQAQMDGTEENQAANVETPRPAASVTRAPWQSRNEREKRS